MFTNVKGTRNKPCANHCGKHNPKQDVVIYLKSIFFQKGLLTNYTDIENSENKKPIRNFRLGCSKAFYIRLPRILKGS